MDREIVTELFSDKHGSAGFSWGSLQNMSYTIGGNTKSEVRSNIRMVMNKLQMNPNKLVTAVPADGKTIKPITQYSQFIEADIILTDRVNLPICFKPADCEIIVFRFTVGEEKRKWLGIIHIGYQAIGENLLFKLSKYLHKHFPELSNMQVYFTPAIHTYLIPWTRITRFLKIVLQIKLWKHLSRISNQGIEFDFPSYLKEEVKGKLGGSLYDKHLLDTDQAYLNGEGFSHHRANILGQRNGRNIVVTMLKQE